MEPARNIKVNILASKDCRLPVYQTKGSSGLDLRASITEPIEISPLQRVLIPTGLAIAIPFGYEGQIRPRSGMAFQHGITCLNSPGTIDSDYRGEIKVLLINLGQEPYLIQPEERIAQLVFCPVITAEIQIVDELDGTVRNKGGFGHTGSF
ncbi:MAG: dUTP diphosphatase [Clostridia bacterium]|nr:dUTP diphosphatase [Clostridia bacterium]